MGVSCWEANGGVPCPYIILATTKIPVYSFVAKLVAVWFSGCRLSIRAPATVHTPLDSTEWPGIGGVEVLYVGYTFIRLVHDGE